jgi:hypothetical protein
VQGPERSRRTVSLGVPPTKSLARERLRGFIERADINSNCVLYARTAPGTKIEQQAEWWIEGLTTRRRRPPKPAKVYAWHHCLNKWILPNLGKKLVSEVGNGALRQFVETLSAAGIAAKTIINIVAVVKLVVALAVNE